MGIIVGNFAITIYYRTDRLKKKSLVGCGRVIEVNIEKRLVKMQIAGP